MISDNISGNNCYCCLSIEFCKILNSISSFQQYFSVDVDIESFKEGKGIVNFEIVNFEFLN